MNAEKVVKMIMDETGKTEEEAKAIYENSLEKSREDVEEILSAVSPFEVPMLDLTQLRAYAQPLVAWLNQQNPKPQADNLYAVLKMIDDVCFDLGFRYNIDCTDLAHAKLSASLDLPYKQEEFWAGDTDRLDSKACHDLSVQLAFWLANQGWGGGVLASALEILHVAIGMIAQGAREAVINMPEMDLPFPPVEDDGFTFGY